MHTYTYKAVAHDFGRTYFSFRLSYPFRSICSFFCSFIRDALRPSRRIVSREKQSQPSRRSCHRDTLLRQCYSRRVCAREQTCAPLRPWREREREEARKLIDQPYLARRAATSTRRFFFPPNATEKLIEKSSRRSNESPIEPFDRRVTIVTVRVREGNGVVGEKQRRSSSAFFHGHASTFVLFLLDTYTGK